VTGFERDLSLRTRELRQNLNPADTLIVGFDSHFLGYRHSGYYLPEFTTVLYHEVQYPDGPRVYLMKGGDTQLVKSIPLKGFRNFALYPLPEGAAYAEYLASVLGKMPQGTVSPAALGPATVWTGPISALPLLFPNAGR
jgi:hypothetical protein